MTPLERLAAVNILFRQTQRLLSVAIDNSRYIEIGASRAREIVQFATKMMEASEVAARTAYEDTK